MGYAKIKNLYTAQDILLFKECYALEKIHGTSAHISWVDGICSLFSGGERADRFSDLFRDMDLVGKFNEKDVGDVVIFGEAYGGSQQRMSGTYGKELKFIVFDIKMNDAWLEVPKAEKLAIAMGLEFVHYEKSLADVEVLDRLRDQPSTQAKRNGIAEDKMAEGIVVKPLVEMRNRKGDRVYAKHKRADFCETRKPRVVSKEKLEVLTEAREIADEWVTPNRLKNILSHLCKKLEMADIPVVIRLMVTDIEEEGREEIVTSKAVRTAVGKATAELIKKKVTEIAE